jgi:putative Ca2+/H+ antiporter (TMEM165/GDT1 family)
LHVLITAVLMVTLSEMGDKTQLLAFALATRFRKPWTVLRGIFIATVANHALAAWAGGYLAQLVTPRTAAIVVAIGFLAFAVWALKPDTLDDEHQPSRWGPLVTTIVLFFLAEMGDKTQLATVALGAKYAETGLVVIGTTIGMLIADGLAIVLGEKLGERLPLDRMRLITAALFAFMGVITLIGAFFPQWLPAWG